MIYPVLSFVTAGEPSKGLKQPLPSAQIHHLGRTKHIKGLQIKPYRPFLLSDCHG